MKLKNIKDTVRFITSHPLNNDSKFASIKKYCLWQINSRLIPGAKIVNYVNHTRLMIEHGMTGATGVVYTGLPDFEEMSFLLHSGRPGDTFIDVGANVGIYTVLAAGGRGMHVLAFEPESKAHRWLKENIHLNNLEEKVKTYHFALGNSDEKGAISTDFGPENRILEADEDVNSAAVEMRRLDAMKLSAPNIIKIDVEGYEFEVLKGAKVTLGSDTLFGIIIETNNSSYKYGCSPQQTRDLLEKYGFKPYEYEPYWRVLKPLHKPETRRKNTIYIRQITYVRRRISTALPFTIRNLTI